MPLRKMLARAVAVALLPLAVASAQTPPSPGLKDVFKNDFLIGTCLVGDPAHSYGPRELNLITSQYNAVTPENCMKPSEIHPAENQWNWGPADALVDFAQQHDMVVFGHNLCWHQQTPEWFFKNPDGSTVTREVALQRLHDHIFTVVQHFKGKIRGWDVVNEAVPDDGSQGLLRKNNPWTKIVGDDYVVKAFQFAHEADPDMQLQYNDYNVEAPYKFPREIQLIKQIQAAVPLYSVGIQGHWQLNQVPYSDIEHAITTLQGMGLKVAFTEVDLDLLPRQTSGADVSAGNGAAPVPAATVTPDMLQREADQYGKLFALFVKHKDAINRVTFWGIDDKHSWLDTWPTKRTNAGLVFDRNADPKPAFYAIVNAAKSSS